MQSGLLLLLKLLKNAYNCKICKIITYVKFFAMNFFVDDVKQLLLGITTVYIGTQI